MAQLLEGDHVPQKSRHDWMESGRQHAEYISDVISGYFEQEVFCFVFVFNLSILYNGSDT